MAKTNSSEEPASNRTIEVNHHLGDSDASSRPVFRLAYRTRDGEAFFVFRIVKVGNHFEADILGMPSYGERSTDKSFNTWAASPRGGFQADIGRLGQLTDLVIVQACAGLWAEAT